MSNNNHNNSDNIQNNNNNSNAYQGGAINPMLAPMPKHTPFPEFPSGNEIINELLMFLYITFSTTLQFINIYHTTWWLEEPYIHHTIHYYLLDPYLIGLIVGITARRLLYCLLLRFLNAFHFRSNKERRFHQKILKHGFFLMFSSVIGACILSIPMQRSPTISFFMLIYPLSVYLLIFGFQIEPFLRTSCEIEGAYFNGMPMHCCSTTPVTIRDEIDILKNDFNCRFKQVIFTSMLNAYYAGFLPCFFAVSVHYDVLWVTQHIVFIWLSGFTMCMVFVFPSKYSDILHRASQHLGYWERLDNTQAAAATAAFVHDTPDWNKTLAWKHGSVVDKKGELFRCVGPVTVAIPGNSSHSRFYRLFQNPTAIYMTLTAVQATLVVAGILLLAFVIEWHFVLSISFVTMTNQYTFFKAMRDYLITKRVYFATTCNTP